MRHFTVTSACVESVTKSKRMGTPAFAHWPNAALICSRKAGLKFAACVEANHTRTGDCTRLSQRRSIESSLAASMSPKYVLVPLRRMRRRVSDRARRSKYDGCRTPVTAGPAAPAELVVAGAIGCGAGGGAGGAGWWGPEAAASVAGGRFG